LEPEFLERVTLVLLGRLYLSVEDDDELLRLTVPRSCRPPFLSAPTVPFEPLTDLLRVLPLFTVPFLPFCEPGLPLPFPFTFSARPPILNSLTLPS
jgi:hypothetical protein